MCWFMIVCDLRPGKRIPILIIDFGGITYLEVLPMHISHGITLPVFPKLEGKELPHSQMKDNMRNIVHGAEIAGINSLVSIGFIV